ncbi:MAG TPA: adenylosuccinate lyase [Bacteroidetes bacterium]|nr:adenylosuccinate lyase [Bacteroidota bacterium]
MIDRYTRPEMGRIWSEQNKYQKWLDVELAVCEVYMEMGKIPRESFEVIRKKADFDVTRILEIEKTTNHDVIAFLTNVAENVGADSRFIHHGMTSSDVLDTAMAMQIHQAGKLLLADLQQLRGTLGERAVEFKDTPCIGRSHGVHAEPVTFGLKLALWYEETGRHIDRLQQANEMLRVGKISGAVGTFAYVDPEVEERACAKLGLNPAPISTQIIQRDRHAQFITTLSLIAATLEKMATEIRALQKTEVLEAEEYFSKGQKGSSAMPHKRNPITCERITGLARLLRGNTVAALENVTLWHERDISHSSVERVIFPDSCITLDYMLNKMNKLIENLLVYPENMLRNLNLTQGLIFSQGLLLKLTDKGLTREDAYQQVQKLAHSIWNRKQDFETVVLASEKVKQYLSEDEIRSCFDLKINLRHVDTIFKRLGLI